jgi:EAL and modified HD-GYP domain-containing signal transduction protein
MSPENVSNSILLARQPIFNNELEPIAYELLFRSTNDNNSGVTELNGDVATSQVINHTFIGLGIERVLGDKLGFINLTRAFLVGDIPLPFDNTRLVLEILEDIVIDDDIIAGVKTLVERGFTIALDDFIYHEDLKPLINLAQIIKIDLLALSEQELSEHVKILKTNNVQLLAEKVETKEQYELCKQLGFDYYQGYFFCKPSIIDGKPLPDNKIAALRILNGLQNKNISINEVETLVSQDVSISFKLLRCLNSAAFSLPKKVESLRQGVIYLGLETIKSWATIIAFSDLPSTTSELMTTALVRAKMAELLAKSFNCSPDTAFLTGLFSPLDAMLSKPIAEILESLPMDEQVKLALEQYEGPLGELLQFIISYEQDNLKTIPSNISISELNNAYLSATEWAIQTESMI